MTHTYHISGMTCNGCVAKAKSELLKLGDVTGADVQLAAPQATITMQKHIPATTLQAALSKAGNYTITETGNGLQHNEINGNTHHAMETEESKTWFATYKPILLIVLYITVIAFIVAATVAGVDWMLWMRVFMSGFFLTFSFFKLLDLKGFANNYSSYDIVAKQFSGWGYVYAFVELGLGLAYAANVAPFATNLCTVIVMSVSLIGVLQSVFNKRKIRCACLGAVFNLPMSTVTIIEDAAMIVMSAIMLVTIS